MTKPLSTIPSELLNAFLLDNKMQLCYKYDDATDPEVQDSINSKFNIDELKSCIGRVLRQERNYYGMTDDWLYRALDEFPIFRQNVALVGSTYPWYEAVLLTRCPNFISVVEYSDRSLEGIKGLGYMKPDDVTDYIEIFGKFDAVISISSFEHDGLGRYGDPLDPDGDFKAMKAWKDLVKPGGLMFLAVPVGQDRLYFNLHRVYGRNRLPRLLDGWETVAAYGLFPNSVEVDNNGEYQPVMVLRNIK